MKSMKKLIIVIQLSVLTISFIANAEYKRTEVPLPMPKGRTEVLDGVAHECFNMEKYKQVGHMQKDYLSLWTALGNSHLKIKTFENENSLLNEKIKFYKYRLKLEYNETKTWKDYALKTEKLLDQREKMKNTFGWIPWVIVVVQSGFMGFVAVK